MKQNRIGTGLYIVIPVFNGWSQTKQCLAALKRSTCQDFHTIVVDHGSTDETKHALRMEFPEVECILGDASLWWAGATNLGIRQAIANGAAQVMLLNNDCYMAPDATERLLAHSDSCGNNCIVAPLTKDMLTGKVLNLGYTTCLLLGFPSIRLPTLGMQKNRGPGGLMPARLIMGGRGVVVPTNVFQRVGLLDEENLPHYLADHDFYLRCKKKGVRLMHATDALLVVDNTRTTIANNLSSMPLSMFLETFRSRKSHRNLRDLTAFFKKHYSVKGLHLLGVGMNFVRYTLIYMGARILNIFSSCLRRKRN